MIASLRTPSTTVVAYARPGGREIAWARIADGGLQGPTIDQLLAAEIGGETLYRSLEVGVGGPECFSWTDPVTNNPAEAARLADKLTRRSEYSIRAIVQGYPFPGIDLAHSEQVKILLAKKQS